MPQPDPETRLRSAMNLGNSTLEARSKDFWLLSREHIRFPIVFLDISHESIHDRSGRDRHAHPDQSGHIATDNRSQFGR